MASRWETGLFCCRCLYLEADSQLALRNAGTHPANTRGRERDRAGNRARRDAWADLGIAAVKSRSRAVNIIKEENGRESSRLDEAKRFVSSAEQRRVFVEDDGDGNILQQLFKMPF